MTTQIRYMERDEFLRLQREAEADAVYEAETRELRMKIAEAEHRLVAAAAELAEAESRT